MVGPYDALFLALTSKGMADWRRMVYVLVDALKESAEVPEADRHALTEWATSPSVRWEFKRVLAAESHSLPAVLAAHVLARLSQDPNPYVRQAAKRAARRRDQTAFSEESSRSGPPVVDALLTRAAKEGEETVQLVGEACAAAHSYAMAEVAHELKTIAQMILTPLRELEQNLGPTKKRAVDESVKKLRRGVKALNGFSKNLQWLAEGKELRFARTDAHTVVSDAIALLPQEQQRRVRAPAGVPVLLSAVHERLVRALGNVVRNAVEASPPDGVVVVEVFRPDEDEVGFRVTDRGSGIPIGQRSGIFQLGATTKREQGLDHHGMGLYIAARVVRLEHGGTIEVGTGPEGGAVFEIRVPVRASRR